MELFDTLRSPTFDCKSFLNQSLAPDSSQVKMENLFHDDTFLVHVLQETISALIIKLNLVSNEISESLDQNCDDLIESVPRYIPWDDIFFSLLLFMQGLR